MSVAYVGQLFADPAALSWLGNRGIQTTTIREAGLGYVAEPLPGHQQFQGAISIPYLDALGRQRAIRFRYLDDQPHPHKYHQPSGQRVGLYRVRDSIEPRPYITEGEFDALVLHQLGHAAVGVPGTQAWRDGWAYLFRDCDLVTLLSDGDEQGRKATRKIARTFRGIASVRVVDLPEGEDVNSLYLKDALGAALDE